MSTLAHRKINTVGAFQLKGESFVILKKEYLDELLTLMKSFEEGERILKTGKTRTFKEFLGSTRNKP